MDGVFTRGQVIAKKMVVDFIAVSKVFFFRNCLLIRSENLNFALTGLPSP